MPTIRQRSLIVVGRRAARVRFKPRGQARRGSAIERSREHWSGGVMPHLPARWTWCPSADRSSGRPPSDVASFDPGPFAGLRGSARVGGSGGVLPGGPSRVCGVSQTSIAPRGPDPKDNENVRPQAQSVNRECPASPNCEECYGRRPKPAPAACASPRRPLCRRAAPDPLSTAAMSGACFLFVRFACGAG